MLKANETNLKTVLEQYEKMYGESEAPEMEKIQKFNDSSKMTDIFLEWTNEGNSIFG